MTTKPRERETYRARTLLGDEVWTEFDHPDCPEGFVVQRVIALRLQCKRCERFTWYGLQEWTTAKDLAEVKCEFCD
jgi:hypothetical protein